MNISEMVFIENAKSRGFTVLRKGWPDFALMNKDGLLFCVEVKSSSDSLSNEQKDMSKFLTLAGIPCFVSRNGEWPDLLKPVYGSESVPLVSDKFIELAKIRESRLLKDFDREVTRKLNELCKSCESYKKKKYTKYELDRREQCEKCELNAKGLEERLQSSLEAKYKGRLKQLEENLRRIEILCNE